MAVTLHELRRILRLDRPLAVLRALAYPLPVPEPLRLQLALWIVDAEGLPPRPWRVGPDVAFDCRALNCRGVLVRVCVARQIATEMQITQQSSRGQGTEYPLCDTRKCAQGRGMRAALDPDEPVGSAGTFWTERRQKGAQRAARKRLALVGLLDEVPTLDTPPPAVEPWDDDGADEEGPGSADQVRGQARRQDPPRGEGGKLPRDGSADGRGGRLDVAPVDGIGRGRVSGFSGGSRKGSRGSRSGGSETPAIARGEAWRLAVPGLAAGASQSGPLGRKTQGDGRRRGRDNARQAPRRPSGRMV